MMVLMTRALWFLGRYYRHTLFVLVNPYQNLYHGFLEHSVLRQAREPCPPTGSGTVSFGVARNSLAGTGLVELKIRLEQVNTAELMDYSKIFQHLLQSAYLLP